MRYGPGEAGALDLKLAKGGGMKYIYQKHASSDDECMIIDSEASKRKIIPFHERA